MRAYEPHLFILETAVQDDKVMQDFDLESLLMGGAFPKGEGAPHQKRLWLKRLNQFIVFNYRF
jgi:hypothetical protein